MKKGFTLVELLGVLILLSLISILIIPNVLRTSSKAEENSFKESVKGLIRSVEEYYAIDSNFPEEGISINELPSDMEIKNIEEFESGLVKIIDSTYYVDDVTNGLYCANGKRNSLIITKGNCELD